MIWVADISATQILVTGLTGNLLTEIANLVLIDLDVPSS